MISEYDKKIKQKNLFVHIKVNKIIKTDTEALKIAL
ncbi:MAG TPA: two-component sensor histidine kinase, partial [Pseudothermotoga sp.]|nr:two-component sensor histidine kinase [Pseudothermotoga sp.]